MYAIHWKCKTTGLAGCSKPILDIKTARELCDERVLKYPDVEHWYERGGD